MCHAVMQAAASRVTATSIQGSSTCCIVLLDTRHGRLASANIGDSGFMILGVTHNNPKPHVKFRTPQQEHQFGCPYQLGHHAAADPPEDAMLTALPVSQHSDLAICLFCIDCVVQRACIAFLAMQEMVAYDCLLCARNLHQ